MATEDEAFDVLGAAVLAGGVGEAKELLALLDIWESNADDFGDEETCMLGPEDGCCMIGPEPLVNLCDRLGKPAVLPALTTLFEQVLKESTREFDESLMGEVGGATHARSYLRPA